MILPDVNVLINAFRDDSPNHRQCRSWLDRVTNEDEAYGISPQVLASVIRIATHPGIFAKPDKLQDVIHFASAVSAPSHCHIVQPGARHWKIFCDLCTKARATGNLVQDAWFAALAIESGCEWITLDRDFARFPGLKWREPA